MSTLADELLNDFEDSGSEGEGEGEAGGEQDAGLFPDLDHLKGGITHATSLPGANDSMELDGDEEEEDDGDALEGITGLADEAEDEEETKAKIEKMQLSGVDDVRSIAVLMQQLEPVLEVSTASSPLYNFTTQAVQLLFRGLALTSTRPCRELLIFNHYLPRNKLPSLALSKTTPNTIY